MKDNVTMIKVHTYLEMMDDLLSASKQTSELRNERVHTEIFTLHHLTICALNKIESYIASSVKSKVEVNE